MATIQSASSPQSVLGFTNNALNKLNESRLLLDKYLEHQRHKIETIQRANHDTYSQQKDRVQAKMNELKSIQRQRGIGIDKENEGADADGNDHELNVNGVAQQKKSYAEKQIEVERQLANLHLEQKETQKTLVAAREDEKVAFTQAEQVRKSKERIEKAKQVTVEELTIGLVKYREIGLDFVKGEGSALNFNFTKIDHRDEERMFSFTLLISEEDDLYRVEDCCPVLGEEVVMRLVDELNRTEDYPCFMRGIRRAFKDSVMAEEQGQN